MEVLEKPTNVRMVIDTDHHLAFATAHELCHALVVLEWNPPRTRRSASKAGPCSGGCEHGRSVPHIQAREIFDIGTRQTLPGGRKVFLDPQQVDRRAGSGVTERLPGDLVGEGMVLQIEESGGSLDVGGGSGRVIFSHSNTWRELSSHLNWRTNSSRWFCTMRYSVIRSPLMSLMTSTGAARGRMKYSAAPPAKTST